MVERKGVHRLHQPERLVFSRPRQPSPVDRGTPTTNSSEAIATTPGIVRRSANDDARTSALVGLHSRTVTSSAHENTDRCRARVAGGRRQAADEAHAQVGAVRSSNAQAGAAARDAAEPDANEQVPVTEQIILQTRSLFQCHQGLLSLRHIRHLEKMTQLRSLNVHMNSIARVEGLSTLHNLVELDLSANELHTLDPHCFDGLHRLRKLNLSSNYLTVIPADVLAPLRALQWLSVAFNELSDVAGLRCIPVTARLHHVDLCGNCIASLAAVEHALEPQREHLVELRLRTPHMSAALLHAAVFGRSGTHANTTAVAAGHDTHSSHACASSTVMLAHEGQTWLNSDNNHNNSSAAQTDASLVSRISATVAALTPPDHLQLRENECCRAITETGVAYVRRLLDYFVRLRVLDGVRYGVDPLPHLHDTLEHDDARLLSDVPSSVWRMSSSSSPASCMPREDVSRARQPPNSLHDSLCASNTYRNRSLRRSHNRSSSSSSSYADDKNSTGADGTDTRSYSSSTESSSRSTSPAAESRSRASRTHSTHDHHPNTSTMYASSTNHPMSTHDANSQSHTDITSDTGNEKQTSLSQSTSTHALPRGILRGGQSAENRDTAAAATTPRTKRLSFHPDTTGTPANKDEERTEDDTNVISATREEQTIPPPYTPPRDYTTRMRPHPHECSASRDGVELLPSKGTTDAAVATQERDACAHKNECTLNCTRHMNISSNKGNNNNSSSSSGSQNTNMDSEHVCLDKNDLHEGDNHERVGQATCTTCASDRDQSGQDALLHTLESTSPPSLAESLALVRRGVPVQSLKWRPRRVSRGTSTTEWVAHTHDDAHIHYDNISKGCVTCDPSTSSAAAAPPHSRLVCLDCLHRLERTAERRLTQLQRAQQQLCLRTAQEAEEQRRAQARAARWRARRAQHEAQLHHSHAQVIALKDELTRRSQELSIMQKKHAAELAHTHTHAAMQADHVAETNRRSTDACLRLAALQACEQQQRSQLVHDAMTQQYMTALAAHDNVRVRLMSAEVRRVRAEEQQRAARQSAWEALNMQERIARAAVEQEAWMHGPMWLMTSEQPSSFVQVKGKGVWLSSSWWAEWLAMLSRQERSHRDAVVRAERVCAAAAARMRAMEHDCAAALQHAAAESAARRADGRDGGVSRLGLEEKSKQQEQEQEAECAAHSGRDVVSRRDGDSKAGGEHEAVAECTEKHVKQTPHTPVRGTLAFVRDAAEAAAATAHKKDVVLPQVSTSLTVTDTDGVGETSLDDVSQTSAAAAAALVTVSSYEPATVTYWRGVCSQREEELLQLRAVCAIGQNTQGVLTRENDRLLVRVDELQRELTGQQTRADALTRERDAALRGLRNLQDSLARREQDCEAMEREARAKLDSKRARIAELEEQLEHVHETLAHTHEQCTRATALAESRLVELDELRRVSRASAQEESLRADRTAEGAEETFSASRAALEQQQKQQTAEMARLTLLLQSSMADRQRWESALRGAREQLTRVHAAYTALRQECHRRQVAMAGQEAQVVQLTAQLKETQETARNKQRATLEALSRFLLTDASASA